MNIREAKEEIVRTIRAYTAKDDRGCWRIPPVRQRPVLLMGPPGIGKTAIMEQAAQECGTGLVAYTITHHTRQSAVGLPQLVTKRFRDTEYTMTEYTMSEIVGSIYEYEERTGYREGILFIDEINCVSETLAPSMLQFLQYKVFGRHQVPEGWVIVTAGNPPEYNKSVREFDVVTLDRLKILEVEADFATWKEYARERGLHTAIVNFLDLKKDDFYEIETTVKGKNYITARGWEDLSKMLELYEEEGIAVEETLIGQYIRNDRVVKEFGAYYDLYQKYKNDYKVEEILTGSVSEQAKDKARKADFDERLSLMGMLIDKIQQDIKENMQTSALLHELMNPLRALKAKAAAGCSKEEFQDMLAMQTDARITSMESLAKAGALSGRDKKKNRALIRFLEEAQRMLRTEEAENAEDAFARIKGGFDGQVAAYKQDTARVGGRLHELFCFVEDTFGSGNEMLLLMTECTVQPDCAKFIASYGCEDYQRHNEELMLTERGDSILERIEALLL